LEFVVRELLNRAFIELSGSGELAPRLSTDQ
jgi:hypothetical protein